MGKKRYPESCIIIRWKTKQFYCLQAEIPQNSTFYTSQDTPKSPNRDDFQKIRYLRWVKKDILKVLSKSDEKWRSIFCVKKNNEKYDFREINIS